MLNQTDTRAFEQHNHKHCIDNALSTARRLCADKGLRLTPIREQVFTLICQSHKPLGAYTILDLLTDHYHKSNQGKTKRIAPPTVYRALEFLQNNGLIHRIATLNAYMGCCRPARSHQSHFLICKLCDITVEFASLTISSAIEQSALQTKFQVDSACVEIIGLCPNCSMQER